MNVAIIIFPGSNCDHDAEYCFKEILNCNITSVWHKETALPSNIDFVFIPGGFSYGDYLRSGAIARFSPIMADVVKFANKGGYVMGVCNGFQVLTECHLLPGALIRNAGLQFICKMAELRVETTDSSYTANLKKHEILRIPIAHGEGNYTCDRSTLKELEDNDLIAFKYCDSNGKISEESNPNGSIANIAGIFNQNKNVLGMMPHPERAMETDLGSSDGVKLFQSTLKNMLSYK
jgi:phosphoribosylformylglycinamidine synthase subunit PurQ / glutaminase